MGAPIAVALLRFDGLGGLAGWRWLFLTEGLPTVVLGLSLFYLLPASPAEARFLSAKEAQVVEDEVHKCRSSRERVTDTRALLLVALRTRDVWHIGMVKFSKDMTFYGTMLWCATVSCHSHTLQASVEVC